MKHGPFILDPAAGVATCSKCGEGFTEQGLDYRMADWACRGRRLTSADRFECRAPTEVLVANRAARMAARGMRR